MADNQTTDLERQIIARMASGEAFTAVHLYGGRPDQAYRLADRLIQRWRKRGWIAYTRAGRATVWRLTEEGSAHAAQERAHA